MKAILPLAIASALVLAACSAPEAPAAADPMPAATETPAEPMPAEAMPAAATNPSVGGASMDAAKDIVTNASAAPNLSTLVTAVKAADLVATLQGAGPFTVFAPTDDAFAKLPAGAVDGLLKPEMKADLAAVLTYHVAAGNVDAAALMQALKEMLAKEEAFTLSIGVAELSSEHGDLKSLLASADRCLYDAKQAGRGRVVFAGGANDPAVPSLPDVKAPCSPFSMPL